MTTRLDAAAIARALEKLNLWRHEGEAICRDFEFVNFVAALGFVDRVGLLAEEAEHHPDIGIRYNKVNLKLSTHSVGGLTAKDFELAARIDELQSA